MSSTTNMDVDDNSRNQSATILVHPLAIVNISDQYTRIVCGGSPLDPSTPVTGLLFGTTAIDNKTNNSNNSNDKNNTIIVIRDAAEDNIYTSSSSSRAHQQVSLHQAVFAQHKVVGWYRVAASPATTADDEEEEGPTVEDLMRTKQLIQDHCQQQHQEPSQQDSFVFALLQVPENKKKESTAASNNSNNNHVQNNELPLSLYMLDDDKNALLAMEDWKLDTAEVERVALERVVREEMSFSTTTNNNNKVLAKIDQLQESFCQIQNRMDILYAFLNDTHTGQIPTNHALLRQAYGVLLLLQQLGAKKCSARDDGGTESAQELQDMAGHEQQEEYSLLQQLAAVTKTITAVQAYADKFRVTGTDFAVVVGKTAAAAAAAAAGGGGAGTASSSRDSRRF